MKVLTPIVRFKRGGQGEIIIRPTVGIGCEHTPSGGVGECSLLISMVSYDDDQCTNVGVPNEVESQRSCKKTIEALDWNRNHSIIIQAREGERHHFSAAYLVQLNVEHHIPDPIWMDYRLPDIKVCVSYFLS